MSTRMRWDKRRPVYRPWYDRDVNPFEQGAVTHRQAVRPKAKPNQAKPKAEPVPMPMERPKAPADALAPKYALRTGDLAKVREALSGAVEATVWCDGGCAPTNPGPMGWGVVILAEGIRVEMYGGGGQRGTNNHAELRGAILAMEALPETCRATIISDSTYIVNGASKWRHGWRARDFKRSGADVPNADLWRRLDSLASGRSIAWQWVRSHNGHAMNELADKLAALGRTGGRA